MGAGGLAGIFSLANVLGYSFRRTDIIIKTIRIVEGSFRTGRPRSPRYLWRDSVSGASFSQNR
jgi:hypothetical protein